MQAVRGALHLDAVLEHGAIVLLGIVNRLRDQLTELGHKLSPCTRGW